MGVKLVEQLFDAKLLTSIADVYQLKDRKDDLLQLERMGEKSVENLLSGIETSKTRPLWRLLGGVNIGRRFFQRGRRSSERSYFGGNSWDT